MFSKSCEYAIRATVYIASQSASAQRTSLKAIAEEIDSPEAFTAKILQVLSKNKIIQSVKGAKGGFEIDEESAKTVRLSDVVRAVDGDAFFYSCGLGLKQCNEQKPCPLHHNFKPIREQMKHLLDNTSIFELCKNLAERNTFLKT